MKRRCGAVGLTALLGLAGCASAYVQAQVENASGSAISLVEVDYPSASFGVGQLAPGATYSYRFKILGSGPTKVMWTDAARKEHTVAGPELHEGQAGSLVVAVDGEKAAWTSRLKP